MPFARILMELCRRVPCSRGAIFVDHEGECVQHAILDAALTTYDMAVAGAHAAPLACCSALRFDTFAVRGDNGVTLIQMVKDRYAVVLVMGESATVPRARWELEKAAHLIEERM
jgi:hypothetical protein